MPKAIQEFKLMQTEIFEIPTYAGSRRTSANLNVVIAYADFSSATVAKQILEESLRVLSSHFVVKTTLWKFDLLNLPVLREIATQDAAEAQIIIISAHKEYGLPEGAKTWVESCLTNPAVKDVAFAALVKDEQSEYSYYPPLRSGSLSPSEGARFNDSTSAPFLDGFDEFSDQNRADFFWFIANEDDGQKLASEKIIQLACQYPSLERIAANQ